MYKDMFVNILFKVSYTKKVLKDPKNLQNPLDCKEIQPVHSEGDQSWVFFGRNDAKAETPVLWPPHAKSWLIGTTWENLGDIMLSEINQMQKDMWNRK